KRTFNEDLANTYCQSKTGLCEAFQDDQEFITESPVNAPAGFPCGWAWTDIQKVVLTLMQGGNFGSSWQWMKDDNTMIACCTDGIRPVIFKIEIIEK
ncbi:MAG: TIGR04076 family protein, partial [Deltaproteobacteria bacterium]|nr:TIGR04076 family protein [Deltaproteobacteria bacterium]